MVLILGGAYQGKGDYARVHYQDKEIFVGLHQQILALSQQEADVLAAVRDLLPCLKDKVVLAEDIFCGIVPCDPVLRRWREDAGRAYALLAAEADEVVRVFCGLGIQLK